MSHAGPVTEFEVERNCVSSYFMWCQTLFVLFVFIWFFGIGLLLAPLYFALIASWLAPRQAAALVYRLEGTTLRVDQGVYFLKRKAIPLDRITDIVMAQGPLMRMCGIWGLQVQTAGTGQQTAEAILYGVRDPETVRDQLLAARDKAAGAVGPAA